MTVEGKIWFSPSAHENPFVRKAWSIFKESSHPFPSEKAHAIKVSTHRPGNPNQPIFPVRTGECPQFKSPEFARHEKEAWGVGNLQVEIGPIAKTKDPTVDRFNEVVMEVFNMASGNMLQSGNVLTWNTWFSAPELVDTVEWSSHAEKWRKSIDADHGAPGGAGSKKARFADGSPFNPVEGLIEHESKLLFEELLRDL